MSEPQATPACLVLCCKAPQQSKRRLTAAIGHRATTTAGFLLACALEDLSNWPGEAVLAPASDEDADWLRAESAGTFESVVQSGDSLGERINHVDGALRSSDRERLIYIGADCPSLCPAYLSRADAALDDHDAVLGPAADGGVVLMGARKPWPALGDLPWSTSELLADLHRRLRAHGWTVAILDTLADIDTVDDLVAATVALREDERPARRALVEWLSRHELSAGTPQ